MYLEITLEAYGQHHDAVADAAGRAPAVGEHHVLVHFRQAEVVEAMLVAICPKVIDLPR